MLKGKRKFYFLSFLVGFILMFSSVFILSGKEEIITSASSELVALDSDTITYDSINDASAQIPNEKNGGIYFLNDKTLSFYNLSTGKTELLETFLFDGYYTELYPTYNSYITYISDYYVLDNYLYLVVNASILRSDDYPRIVIYDLDAQKITNEIYPGFYFSSVCADSNGRMLVAAGSDEIFLLSATGTVLSSYTLDDYSLDYYYSITSGFVGYSSLTISSFDEIFAFDSETGIFYTLATTNWVYWGYDHDMSVICSGKVSGTSISLENSYAIMICQQYWYERQKQAEAFGNKYICIDNTFNSLLEILDYSKFPSSNDGAFVFYQSRNSENFDDMEAVGTRTVYLEDTDSIVTYTGNNTLTEYNLSDGSEVGSSSTTYTVFSLMKYGDEIIAIEKDDEGNFYLERIPWSRPTSISLTANSTTINVGKSTTINASSDGTLSNTFTYTSSDSKIASVNQSGKVTGWNVGTAVITVTDNSGLSAEITITVKENSSLTLAENESYTLSGAKSENISANNYSTYGNTVNSYLVENSDGTITRVEYTDSKVKIETYTSDGKTLKSTKTLKVELGYFGGFYSGEKYNFIVYGASNLNESDDCEVVRVVKYSKSWEKLGSLSYKGCNTYIAFDAGSLRMTETNDKLYLHTCHEMYDIGDGYHHQANMTFVLTESTMAEEQAYYDIMNIAQAGYVSHSFNQFIQTDGTYVYRVDHGDAYPRGISITKCEVDGSIEDVDYIIPISLDNVTGDNATGASVGGFELTNENCIIAGNAVDYTQDSVEYDDIRNIFVSITDKELNNSETIWITSYDSSSNVTVRTPQLVKLGDDQFLLMWEEVDSESLEVVTAMVTMDGNGNLTNDIVRNDFRLSDCKPIYCSDGYVRWYVTDSSKPTLYTINPFLLASYKVVCEGDSYTIGDLNYTVTKVADNGTGTVTLTGVDKKKATVKIPATITIGKNTYKVTAIAKDAFKNNKKIKNLVIGKNVKTIGANAFAGCTKLKNLKIGKGVTSIGKYAFKNCKKLTKVTIPAKVKTIGKCAFMNCTKLKTLVIGKGVKKIGKKAFYNCKKLKSITIKSKKLKTSNVGKKAFAKIRAKVKIKVPKSKLKAYTKLLYKKGISKKAKITTK